MEELIYRAWRDSESYSLPVTEEGMKLAEMRYRGFKKGWEYAEFHAKTGNIHMKDYLEHGSEDD